MNDPRDIAVQWHTEGATHGGCASAAAAVTANADPLLHEIRHALAALQRDGAPTVIDLSAIPFAPGDEARLLAALGQGEVQIAVRALGETLITETAYPGVWLVDYRAPGGARQALQVEITDVPALGRTPGDALRESLERLTAALADTPAELAEQR